MDVEKKEIGSALFKEEKSVKETGGPHSKHTSLVWSWVILVVMKWLTLFDAQVEGKPPEL
ncbi:hypothetical protein ACFLQU_00990 [Verrucomicrobiota bacterium]